MIFYFSCQLPVQSDWQLECVATTSRRCKDTAMFYKLDQVGVDVVSFTWTNFSSIMANFTNRMCFNKLHLFYEMLSLKCLFYISFKLFVTNYYNLRSVTSYKLNFITRKLLLLCCINCQKYVQHLRIECFNIDFTVVTILALSGLASARPLNN